jgi:sugar-specific transcriptional regulator TrmB
LNVYSEDPTDDAVDLLQQFGLKEYETRCFVALSQLSTGTAKQIAATADVPKTRVYDSVRVLEARGLAKVQHTTPRRFRTVSIDEAMATLRAQYENRIERLTHALERLREEQPSHVSDTKEVWSLVGTEAIRSRVARLINDADDVVVVIVGDESHLTDELLDRIDGVDDVEVVVVVLTGEAERRVRKHAPLVRTAISTFDWMPDGSGAGGVAVGTVLLVDDSHALVSTIMPDGEERAVIGTAHHNGLVALVYQLTDLAIDR